jgi:hypothetical protein
VPAHILRGYIRRAQYNVTDHPSQCRLQFLYNPTQITRNYVSYLDQGALDPFNTVYQSGNLVAPPSFMDFTFELLFDRQEEATNPKDPGVMIDMDYFDLVVRNVVPTSQRGNSLPDNGVMMVNPRDITVVFSPTLTVQGRPTNAQVVFNKFTHRMTPTRMTIALTMRVVYLGPVRDLTTFVNEEVNVARRIPFDIQEPQKYGFSYNPIEWTSNGEDIDPKSIVNGDPDVLSGMSGHGGELAANVAYNRWIEAGGPANGTVYSKGKRAQLWKFADCSSFVWGGFADNRGAGATSTTAATTQSMAEKLGWPKWPSNSPTDTAGMFSTFANDQSKAIPIFGGGGLENGLLDDQWEFIQTCQKGDILLRHNNPRKEGGHVAFVWANEGDRIDILHASGTPGQNNLPTGVGINSLSAGSTIYYNYGFRVVIGESIPEEAVESPLESPSAPTEAPSKPRDLTVEVGGAVGVGNARLRWLPPSNSGSGDIAEYRIEYRRTNVATSTEVVVAATPTDYLLTGLEHAAYFFAVRARNNADTTWGPLSSRVSGTPA